MSWPSFDPTRGTKKSSCKDRIFPGKSNTSAPNGSFTVINVAKTLLKKKRKEGKEGVM